MELTKQTKAAILSDFVNRYNKVFGEDWTIDINNFVEVYRPGLNGKYTCTGHFIDSLVTFCKEKIGKAPCVSCFNEEFRFFI